MITRDYTQAPPSCRPGLVQNGLILSVEAVPGYCARRLFPPLLQKCDVHNEEQGHEEARNQYKWETLHQTRVVKRAEQDCIQEIGDAEQVLQKVNRRNRFIAEGAMKAIYP